MKKNIRIFVIGYLLFLMANVMVSCTDCGGSGPSKYNFTSFDWQTSSIRTVNNYFQSTDIVDETVSFHSYGIDIKAITESYYAKKINFDLLNDIYACSPVPPTTDDVITNIEIITNSNFDVTHPAGSDVSTYFDIGSLGQKYYTSSISMFVNVKYEELLDFFLLLNTSPEITGEMNFTVKITLEGKTLDYFEFTTNTVTITNN